MSRIDINVKEIKTGKMVANRGFCRSLHLARFCEASQDHELQDFASTLAMGVDITDSNINDFLNSLRYVVSYLEELNDKEVEKISSAYEVDLYSQFLNDLRGGFEFLESLRMEQRLQELAVMIV